MEEDEVDKVKLVDTNGTRALSVLGRRETQTNRTIHVSEALFRIYGSNGSWLYTSICNAGLHSAMPITILCGNNLVIRVM